MNHQMIFLQTVFRYQKIVFFIPFVNYFKKLKIVINTSICLIFIVLQFIVEWLASTICVERPSPTRVLGRTKWVKTECNL